MISLVRLKRRCCRDEGHATLAEWLGERLERHLGIVRPDVGLAVTQRLVVVAGALQIRNWKVVRRGEDEIRTRAALKARLWPELAAMLADR